MEWSAAALRARVGTDHDQKGDLVVVGSYFLLHDTTKIFLLKMVVLVVVVVWSWFWSCFGRILVVFSRYLAMILWFSTIFSYFFPNKIQILLKIVYVLQELSSGIGLRTKIFALSDRKPSRIVQLSENRSTRLTSNFSDKFRHRTAELPRLLEQYFKRYSTFFQFSKKIF